MGGKCRGSWPTTAIDLIIMDLMLPDEDGLSLCRKVRARSQVPIIMLTARGEDIDRIVGLEMGADDYMAKPFNPRELLARINAVLRRQASALNASENVGATCFSFDGWRMDFRLRELRNPAGARVALTSAEFDLLRAFCERAGQGAVARSAARIDARPQLRLVRSQHRRAGEPDPSQDRSRPGRRADDQDGALRRLHVHAGGRTDCNGAGVEPPMKRLDVVIPKRISGQIAAIVVISIVVINAILATVFFLNRPDEQQRDRRPEPGQLTALIQMLGSTPKQDRPGMIAMMTRTFPQFDIRPAAPDETLGSQPR